MDGTEIGSAPPDTGLAHWMRQVLVERQKTLATFSEDAVHDLRVAIRRCRSLAAGFREIDPHPDWRGMNREGRRLFRALGDMRDTQVLIGWAERLAPPESASAAALLEYLRAWEVSQRNLLEKPLVKFDERYWLHCADVLPWRASRVELDSPAFEQLALRRYDEARALHRTALRNRSKVAFHQLRIGIKRLRYTVENFLPARHARWGKSLKKLQDALGEVHDLDVLWDNLLGLGSAFNAAERAAWRAAIAPEREARIDAYRNLMVGPASLWASWRKGLPDGEALRDSGLAFEEAWASFVDTDITHARHVRRIAEALAEGLVPADAAFGDERFRLVLRLAATAFHSGSDRRSGAKIAPRSARLLRARTVPAGLTAGDVETAALVVESLERPVDAGALDPSDRADFETASAVLRLARALDWRRDGCVAEPRVAVEATHIRVDAPGLPDDPAWAERLARERHALERRVGRAILIPQTLGL